MTLANAARFVRELANVVRIADPSTAGRYLGAVIRTLPAILRRRSLAPADAGLVGTDITIRFDGRTHRFSAVPFELLREIFGREVYFPEPGWRPAPGELVIDLGTNRGVFAILSALRGCTVVAVDAMAYHDAVFADLVRRNGVADRIRHVHGIIAPGTGLLADPERRIDPGFDAAGIAADAVALDGPSLVGLAGGRRIGFLKVDIEGSEFALFDGDPGWLRQVDRIALEVHPAYGDPGALCATLRAAGFQAWLADAAGRRTDRIRDEVGFCYALAADPAPGG